jgi:hypothetical protein
MVVGRASEGSRGENRAGIVAALAGIILLAALVIAGSWPWRADDGPRTLPRSPAGTTSPSPSGQDLFASYAGEAACMECHPGPAALQRRSGHSRTLRPAERISLVSWLNGKSVSDPTFPDVRWSYHVRDDRLSVERTAQDRTESLALDYAVGSGKHGVTFVAISGDENRSAISGIEHRFSYFPDGPRLAITPGQEHSKRFRRPGDTSETVAFGVAMGPDHLRQCFGCHATWISPVPQSRLGASDLIPNVSCERCHGPGRAHVDAARRGETELTMRLGNDRGEAWVEVNLCGECHRLPRVVSGSSLRPDNPGIVRFQGVGLSMSACYANGQGGLRCTTCHDPHDRASSDLTHYEAVCLSCHRPAASQKACPVSPAANCIGCHMPRREVSGNGAFTDHWIRKPAGPDPEPTPPKSEAARTSSTF